MEIQILILPRKEGPSFDKRRWKPISKEFCQISKQNTFHFFGATSSMIWLRTFKHLQFPSTVFGETRSHVLTSTKWWASVIWPLNVCFGSMFKFSTRIFDFSLFVSCEWLDFSIGVENGVKSKFKKEKGKLGKPQRSDFALRGVDPMVEEKIEAAFKSLLKDRKCSF